MTQILLEEALEMYTMTFDGVWSADYWKQYHDILCLYDIDLNKVAITEDVDKFSNFSLEEIIKLTITRVDVECLEDRVEMSNGSLTGSPGKWH